jgi:hypothetical protein
MTPLDIAELVSIAQSPASSCFGKVNMTEQSIIEREVTSPTEHSSPIKNVEGKKF